MLRIALMPKYLNAWTRLLRRAPVLAQVFSLRKSKSSLQCLYKTILVSPLIWLQLFKCTWPSLFGVFLLPGHSWLVRVDNLSYASLHTTSFSTWRAGLYVGKDQDWIYFVELVHVHRRAQVRKLHM